MRSGSEQGLTRVQIEAALKRIVEQHYKRDINEEEGHAITDLGKTYLVFDTLRQEKRDSVWAYVARNLSRPLAYSAGGGWAHVVVGNPPWLAYRYMSADLQKRFRELAKAERVYVGGRFATQNDLSALFTVRAAGTYLRAGGRIAFVLPLAALTRGQFEKFRAGCFEITRLAFDAVWTMDDSVQPLFPVPSCVVFARKRAIAQRMPNKVRAYSGLLPYRDAPEDVADAALMVQENAERPTEATFKGGSPYRKAFRQGATLVPRMLCLVERRSAGAILGGDTSRPHVASRRSSQEKRPWKSLPGIEGAVEAEFIHPVLLGESIVPYRILRSFEGVIPVMPNGAILDAAAAATRGFSGLHAWMKAAEAVWKANAESGDMKLIGRWNYHNELGAQFPIQDFRVLYAASGTIPAACVLRETNAAIEHKLYWARLPDENEAFYLTAILNSETARKRIASLQSRGQWGARDFDKVMLTLPIPPFDVAQPLHAELAAAAEEAESVATGVEFPERVKFQHARKLVRDALTEAGIAQKIDSLVAHLLDRA